MSAQPYLNEPIALLLGDQLSSAIATAQAMAENAIVLEEQINPRTAMLLHQQLCEIERCVCRAIGLVPDPTAPSTDA